MLKASNKKLEQQNQSLKKQVEYLQKLSQSKIDFQNALVVEQERNSLLKDELDNAKITIKHQKEKLKSLDIENDKFRNEVEKIDTQNTIRYKDR